MAQAAIDNGTYFRSEAEGGGRDWPNLELRERGLMARQLSRVPFHLRPYGRSGTVRHGRPSVGWMGFAPRRG